MTTFIVKVQRAQAFFRVINGLSYNYKYEPKHISLWSDTEVWEASGCNYQDAREKYISFVKSGIAADFTNEINFCKSWLAEHGDKTHWLWEGTIKNYKRDLIFLEGGYLEAAKKFQPVRAIYKVETLKPYALGTFDKRDPKARSLPHREQEKFEIIEDGFLLSDMIE